MVFSKPFADNAAFLILNWIHPGRDQFVGTDSVYVSRLKTHAFYLWTAAGFFQYARHGAGVEK